MFGIYFQKYFDYLVEFANDNVIIIILVASLLPMLEAFVPALPLVAIVGVDIVLFCAIFPPVLGTMFGILTSIIGSFIGTMLVYLAIRHLFGKKIRQKVSNMPKVNGAVEWIENSSNLLLILILSNPYTPTSIFNYGMALVDFPFRRYLVIMAISRIVCVGLLGILGVIFDVGSDLKAFIWITVTYVAVFIFAWLLKKVLKILNDKNKENEKWKRWQSKMLN